MTTEREDPVAASVWGRDDRQTAPRGRQGMTREQIVEGAVTLLDAEGPDGLSMRKLGTHLGTGTTSVYWYVANKGQLLDLALDAVLGEVVVPDEVPADWRAAVGDYVRGVRRVMLTHAWIPSVIGHRPNAGPNSIGLSERILSMLESIGFSLADAARASSSLTAYALGNAVSEVAWRTAISESGMSAAELAESYTRFYETSSDEHPVFARWWAEVQPLDLEQEREDSFEFGLQCQLDGLEARLAASSATGRRRRR